MEYIYKTGRMLQRKVMTKKGSKKKWDWEEVPELKEGSCSTWELTPRGNYILVDELTHIPLSDIVETDDPLLQEVLSCSKR